MNDYSLIWKDSGSDARDDVSIWHPVDPDNDYQPLGDIATLSYGKPSISAMTVSAKIANGLAPPVSFSEVGMTETVALIVMSE